MFDRLLIASIMVLITIISAILVVLVNYAVYDLFVHGKTLEVVLVAPIALLFDLLVIAAVREDYL